MCFSNIQLLFKGYKKQEKKIFYVKRNSAMHLYKCTGPLVVMFCVN